MKSENGNVLDIDKNEEEDKNQKSLMKKLSKNWMCCSQKYSMITKTMTKSKTMR